MAYRRLGGTNFMVSEIVVGGLAVRPDHWEQVLYALDQGVNHLDTARQYGPRRDRLPGDLRRLREAEESR